MDFINKFFHQVQYPETTVNIYDVFYTDELGYKKNDIQYDITYNGFKSFSEFETNLQVLFDKICHDITLKLKGEPDTRINKLLYLQELQQKIKRIDRTISFSDSNGDVAYFHKNLKGENISKTFPYEGDKLPQHALKNYFIISKQFLSDFQVFLSDLIDFIKHVDDKDLLQPKNTIEKLKTNLSVADLSTLFRILYEAELIEVNNKVDISRFVSDHFESKNVKEISADSANNKFISPTPVSLDFWYPKFLELRGIIEALHKK